MLQLVVLPGQVPVVVVVLVQVEVVLESVEVVLELASVVPELVLSLH